MNEIEVKVLNIDRDTLREKLRALGAVCEGREFQQNRMYDYPDRRLYLQEDGSYIRIRLIRSLDSNASEQILTLKKTLSRDKYKIAQETETAVADPEAMEQFLLRLGFVRVRIDEKIRESWVWQKIRFELDEWAGLPPYLEVEAPDEAAVSEGLARLGYGLEEATSMNLNEVLALYKIEADSLCFADFGHTPPELKKGISP
ncbi:MAG: class IV adenylate cyclase [Candidatus Sericytochromatia bacterium]